MIPHDRYERGSAQCVQWVTPASGRPGEWAKPAHSCYSQSRSDSSLRVRDSSSQSPGRSIETTSGGTWLLSWENSPFDSFNSREINPSFRYFVSRFHLTSRKGADGRASEPLSVVKPKRNTSCVSVTQPLS